MYEDQRMVPPVKEGEQIDVTIEAVGEKGDGITKVRNFVIFVPNTKQGDRVKIKITKVLKRVGFGEVVGAAETKAAHEHRNEPEPQIMPEPESNYEDSEDFGNEEDY